MRGDNPITDADVRSAMNDMEHHGALVKQLFKERDELRAKLTTAEVQKTKAVMAEIRRYETALAETEDQRDAALAQVRKMREANEYTVSEYVKRVEERDAAVARAELAERLQKIREQCVHCGKNAWRHESDDTEMSGVSQHPSFHKCYAEATAAQAKGRQGGV